MRILLIGEYSRLHNSLKEGLVKLGHEVIIVADSDGFKKFPVDFSIDHKFCKTKTINICRQIISKFSGFDIAKLEQGIRFRLSLQHFKNFDVVQFINESPIKTTKPIEFYLLKKIFKFNKKIFILSCGVDYLNMKYNMENKTEKSILQPYFTNQKLKIEYAPLLKYLTSGHKKIHDLVMTRSIGIIATDFDYVSANINNSKYLGLIPYPINLEKLTYNELPFEDKIVIFIGINKWNYNQKGILFFEKALEIIQQKYNNKVEIIVANTIPYSTYINLYNKAHILLDQSYSKDQGYNALEAMAKGKVVFTGAEKEFVEYYKLTDRVCINAVPNVDYLVNELSYLIENPQEIIAIGKRAKSFVEKEHNYIKIAKKYLEVWNKN